MEKGIISNLKVQFSIYVLLCSILICYLYQIRFETFPNGYLIFWILIILIYSLLFFQVLYSGLNSKTQNYVILELIILNMVLYGIFQLPFVTYFGSDAHFEKVVIDYIQVNGFMNLNFTALSPWPIFHIFGSIISIIIDNIYLTMKVSPFLLGIAYPILLYKFYYKILEVYNFEEDFKNNSLNCYHIAFLASIFTISIYNQFLMSSTFIRQSLAIILILLVTYLYFYRFNKNKWDYIIISIILIVLILEITMTHHFSSLILLLVFFILILSEKFKHKLHVRQQLKHKLENKVSLTFLMLILIVIFSYWMYVANLPLITISNFLHNLFVPITTVADSYVVNTLRDRILFYGFFFFNGIFSIVLLIQFKNLKKIYSFVLILFSFGLIGFLGLFITNSGLYPDRFLEFGWIFGSLPLIIGFMTFRNKKVVQLGLAFLFIFICFNFYQIDPDIYSSPKNYIYQPTLEDYALISKVNMSSGMVLSGVNTKQVIADSYGNQGIDPLLNLPGGIKANTMSYRYRYIVISNKYAAFFNSEKSLFKSLSNYITFTKNLDSDDRYNKIADSNNLSIYQFDYGKD